MNKKPLCVDCLYYDNGQCKRYPPIYASYMDKDGFNNVDFDFPTVPGGNWCGEWKEII